MKAKELENPGSVFNHEFIDKKTAGLEEMLGNFWAASSPVMNGFGSGIPEGVSF